MSLINKALRKAQQDRTPNRMPPSSGAQAQGRAHTTPTESSGMKPGIIVGLIAIVALLIGVIAGLSVVIFKDDAPAIKTAAQPSAQQPAPIQPIITPAQPVTQTPTIEPAAKSDATPKVLDELRIAREAEEAKAVAQAAAEATAKEEAEVARLEAEAARLAEEAEVARKAALKPSQDIITWLSQAKFGGVRISASGNKVILNDEAYTVGDTVHLSFGLKVLLIEEKRILFIDNNGKKYMKRI